MESLTLLTLILAIVSIMLGSMSLLIVISVKQTDEDIKKGIKKRELKERIQALSLIASTVQGLTFHCEEYAKKVNVSYDLEGIIETAIERVELYLVVYHVALKERELYRLRGFLEYLKTDWRTKFSDNPFDGKGLKIIEKEFKEKAQKLSNKLGEDPFEDEE